MKTLGAIVLAAVAVVMLIAFVGRGPSLSQAEANYCADLADYTQAVADVRRLNENSTMQEAEEAAKALEKSWQELRQSGQALRQAKLNEVESSYKTLQQTIGSAPKDATLDEARADIYQAALDVVANPVAVQRVTCTYDSPSQQ
jgi:predicted Zn-dependent protease